MGLAGFCVSYNGHVCVISVLLWTRSARSLDSGLLQTEGAVEDNLYYQGKEVSHVLFLRALRVPTMKKKHRAYTYSRLLDHFPIKLLLI